VFRNLILNIRGFLKLEFLNFHGHAQECHSYLLKQFGMERVIYIRISLYLSTLMQNGGTALHYKCCQEQKSLKMYNGHAKSEINQILNL
jgi:hypothetical protein